MSKPVISIIVAAAENGVIGRDGDMPWHIPSDFKMFRRLTMGKPIIMGRKTFTAIGRPLDGRTNIVITRRDDLAADGIEVARSIDEAVAIADRAARTSGVDEIMVIGGAEIYRALLPLARRIYLTRVHAEPAGDTLFPALDPGHWCVAAREPLPRGDQDDHAATLLTLERI